MDITKKIIVVIAAIFLSTIAFTQTTYTFNGNGKWSDSSNWVNRIIPPAILDSGSQIIVNPAGNGQCVLDTLQFVSHGASVNIAAGKKFSLSNIRPLPLGAKLYNGKISLPIGSSIDLKDLTIISLLNKSKPSATGLFTSIIPATSKEDILVVTDRNDKVIMLKYITDTTSEFSITSETTAMGLLILYPMLQPVDVIEKKKLIENYKKEPEFAQLVTEVESLNKQGNTIFDSTNDNLIILIKSLIAKDYNNVRNKSQSTPRLLSYTNPIFLSSENSSVILTNTLSCSYTGQVYKDNKPLGTPFNIAGNYLSGNPLFKDVLEYLTDEKFRSPQTVDLKTLDGTPGEYEIRITNGDPSFEGTNLNEIAKFTNLAELSAMMLGNLIPSLIKFKDPCVKAAYKSALKINDLSNMYKAVKEGTVIESYLQPILKEMGKALISTTNDCVSREYVKSLLDYYNLIGKLVPVISYLVDWGGSKSPMTACQLLDNNFNASSCIKVKALSLPIDTRICKTIPLQISTVENEKYYPYTSAGVGNKDVVLQALDGKFVSTNFLGVLNTKTNQFGDAQTDWITPSIPKDAKVKVSIFSNGIEITTDTFKTKTSKYNPISIKLDTLQVGEINKPLPKYIQFAVLDKNTGILPEPIAFEKYTVKYIIKGGGSLKLKPDEPNQGIFVINEWTLGPEEGEQSLTAMISTVPCDNQSLPETILTLIFTATAYDPAKLFVSTKPISSITDISALCGGNIITQGNSPITERGICWSTSPNPNYYNFKTKNGAGIGDFESLLSNLASCKTYYVRAYAINSSDTVYGNEVVFTYYSKLDGDWEGVSSYEGFTNPQCRMRLETSYTPANGWVVTFAWLSEGLSIWQGTINEGVITWYNIPAIYNAPPWSITENTINGTLTITVRQEEPNPPLVFHETFILHKK